MYVCVARARTTRARIAACAGVCGARIAYREYSASTCAPIREGRGLFIEEFRDRHTVPRSHRDRLYFFWAKGCYILPLEKWISVMSAAVSWSCTRTRFIPLLLFTLLSLATLSI